jgi:hypothetical protein
MSIVSHAHFVDFNLQQATQPAFVQIEFFAVNITKLNYNCKLKFLRKFSSFFIMFHHNREASNIPLQQIPYYQSPPTTTTQQKGRPRKRKPPQSDETILTSPDGPPEHHLNHDGTLRLGECTNIDFR